MSNLAPPEYMSVADLAAYTSLTPDYWNRLRCEGGGPQYAKLSARLVRYKRSDVDEWIAERLRASTFAEVQA